MRSFIARRMLPVFMAITMVCPFCIAPASAVSAEVVISVLAVLTSSANAIKSLFDATAAGVDCASAVRDFFEDGSSDICPYVSSSYYFNSPMNRVETTVDVVEWLAQDWNNNYARASGCSAFVGVVETDTGAKYKVIDLHWSGTGGGRNDVMRWFMCDGYERILCAPVEEEAGPGLNVWIPEDNFGSPYHLLTYEELYNLAHEAGADVAWNDQYYYIYQDHGSLIYADSSGLPYAARRNPENYAPGTGRPATEIKDENGDPATDEDGNVLQETVEGDNININMEGMTVTLPDGSINMIDQLIYDESTKTYYIDSHDTINNTVNNYYSWTYHINYTSITYIGQTEEYNKYYEVYYELPDGRSSADLTAEELEQLNLTIDVIPYGRSADDTSLRSLYHFDGDTKDSSYWNYCTDFEWNDGASLTYMDAGVFNGALYLDENLHMFTMTLPSNLGIGDFTLQFRYYQSHTEAPVTDSYVEVGGHGLLRLDGANLLDKNRVVMAKIPTGTWNEIALIRDGNKVFYYLNGISIGSADWYNTANNLIKFRFGSEQQTYKYLDEFRLLNRAIVPSGESYTPTSVPHDTNLTLVLPDSAAPVADEYFEVKFDDGAFLAEDLTDNATSSGTKTAVATMTTADGLVISASSSTENDITAYQRLLRGEISVNQSKCRINFKLPSGLSPNYWYPIYGAVSVGGKTYSLSGLMNPGNPDSDVSYAIFIPYRGSGYAHADTVFIPNGAFSFAYDYLMIAVDPQSAGVLLEAVEIYVGDAYHSQSEAQAALDSFASQFDVNKITSIVGIDKDAMNTPTLAVRTDIAITNYQIGGVRPSIPYKGLVWALVEKGYITSIQIYNGQAWESVDGRIWTGERWIPYSSYNVITLQDMYDIVDATPNFEYIYTESGFWSWWQKSWNSFTERFFASGGSSGTIAPGTVKETVSNALSALITGLFTTITEVLKSLIGAGADLISGFFGFLSETVLGGVKDFFSSFTDGSLFGFFQQENEDGTSTFGLPAGISGAFAFISGVIMLLPDELRNLLIFGVGALLFFAVLKIVKA